MTTNSNLPKAVEGQAEGEKHLTQKELRGIFWRSFPVNIAWHFERQMHLGCCYSMIPVIKKLYSKREDRIEAYQRHLEFYNTQVTFHPLIMGIVASMEEENANNPDFDTSSINAMKAALMAPFAGIGDSLIAGTLRIVATGVATGLCMAGNLLGPILFLLIYNVPTILIRWFGLQYGYKLGSSLIGKLTDSDIMNKVTSALAVIGLMVIGGMAASTISVSTPLAMEFSGTAFALQDTLDDIFPKLLPLATFGILYGMNKKHVSVLVQIVGIVVTATVLGVLGIIG